MEHYVNIIFLLVVCLLISFFITIIFEYAAKRGVKLHRRKVKSDTQKYINSLEHHRIY